MLIALQSKQSSINIACTSSFIINIYSFCQFVQDKVHMHTPKKKYQGLIYKQVIIFHIQVLFLNEQNQLFIMLKQAIARTTLTDDN